MSSTTRPYQLCPNKAIERNIFIETLSKLSRYIDIERYTYVGFGGPFLEDFKIMHTQLGLSRMISLEQDHHVQKRQEFNKPVNCIDCNIKVSGEFINEYSFDDKTIIWLDYTSAGELGEQLNEVEHLMSKLADYDIVKVTLNADLTCVAKYPKKGEELRQTRLRLLKKRAGKFLPSDISDEDDIDRNELPNILRQTLENAIKSGSASRKQSYFQPLTSFVYADGLTMMTLTGIILPDDNEKQKIFFDKTGLDRWAFGNTDWGAPKPIKAPQLSFKERIKIEEMLPTSNAEEILRSLGHLVDASEEQSKEVIENYIKYYRQFPYFSRVFV